MTSQSLYRKWRSQTFNDLVGQEPVIRTLKNALRSGKPAHAYLFTGPRGTGKTSTARLLAKTINCLNPQDGEPCNVCQQCREITAGNSFNVIEIDAASNRGIDSIRDLREKVMMPPSTGKYKVYVLDEAHMLTPEAFNALLKTLEEPPDYVIFVLATTDVHKMLPTVLSRCQRFDFKRITTRQIVEHLNFVAGQEHVKLEPSAAELLARAAAGGMRDALSLLDQAIAYAGEEIALAQVQAMLGVADPRAIHKFIMHVAELNSSAGLHLIHELSEAGADLRQIYTQVGEYWRALMLARAGADIAAILDRTEDEVREIAQTAQLFDLEELTEAARIFAQSDLVQKNSGTPQLGLELALLQCIELHRRVQSGLSASISVAAPASAIQPAQPRPARVQPQPRMSVPSAQAASSSALMAPIEESEKPIPSPAHGVTQQIPPSEVYASSSSDSSSTPASPAEVDGGQPPLTVQQVKDAWEMVKKRTGQKNKLVAPMLDYYTAVGVENMAEYAVVSIQPTKDTFYRNMQQGDRLKHVEWALKTEFGRECRVRLVPPGQSLPAPMFHDAGNIGSYSANMSLSSAPSHPASIPPSQSKQTEQGTVRQQTQELNGSPVQPSDLDDSLPLARTNVVRENTVVPSGVPQVQEETIEQRASRDPVVQEVMKTFGARIVEIRPK